MINTGDQEPGLLHVDTESFIFHASLPRVEHRDALFLGVHNERKVISVEKRRRNSENKSCKIHPFNCIYLVAKFPALSDNT